MLNGKELGQAIAQAIKLKKASGAISREVEVARHFGVKQPSLADWKKRGTISKEKLPELWRYFSDVVGPEHWGLKELPADSGSASTPDSTSEQPSVWDAYERADDATRAIVDAILGVGKVPPWLDATAHGILNVWKASAAKLLHERKKTKNAA
ncbi:hypothetical protein [Pandoraea apista]|uniref:hypothetical protein n=1 Tax=Pandoraea apista TaxID=93218 RepID=UPI00069A6C29|nr:hypothetical protein [Pandoraea apista]